MENAILKTFKKYLPAQMGEIRTTDEKVVGKHEGLCFTLWGKEEAWHWWQK